MSNVSKVNVQRVKCPVCKSRIEVLPSDIVFVQIQSTNWDGRIINTKYKAFKCPACEQIIYKKGLKWRLWKKRYVEDHEKNEKIKLDLPKG